MSKTTQITTPNMRPGLTIEPSYQSFGFVNRIKFSVKQLKLS
jgi:hypothetical protein